MPLAVYILGLTIFSVATSEFMIAGMMPSLTAAFNVSITKVGYLISIYAASMVIGGPILTAILIKMRIPHKRALLSLIVIYTLGQSVGAMANSYGLMVIARIITGVAASACFGVALAICGNIAKPESRGRAAAVVVSGLMFATMLGLPIATVVDQQFGWRASFWLVVALTALCGIISSVMLPASSKPEEANLAAELDDFKNIHLWAAYATSGMVLGATFAAFSYFSPILTEITGIASNRLPLLFSLYGIAALLGNIIVGRLADKYMLPITTAGLLVLLAALTLFALFTQNPIISITAMMLIGLVGISMNPVLIIRVMRNSRAGPLVNTVHTSVINIGLAVGSWLGGLAISSGYGLRAPLWVGAMLAVLGIISLLPYFSYKINSPKTCYTKCE